MPWTVLTGRAVAPGEPLWTDTDTQLAVALMRVESAACPGCGMDRRETTDPASEFAYQAEAVRCHACAARDRAAEHHQSGGGTTAGLMFTITRRNRG